MIMESLIRISTLLWILVVLTEGDIHINCIYSEDCILPCRFKEIVGGEVLHWLKDYKTIHSFYEGQDQLGHQDKDYEGRTALFLTQINNGNASLLIKTVRLQDKGRYKCYTSNDKGNEESYVVVAVKAPVKSLNITETDDEVMCTSEEVYPAPTVSWSTIPSSDQENLKMTTEIPEDQQGLFSVKSTLKKIPVNSTTYICSITSSGQTWTACLRHTVEKNMKEGQSQSIQCPVYQSDSQDFSITWTFNSTTTIVTYDTQTQELKKSDQWEHVVKTVTGEGTLQLQNLRSTEHSGTYTCDRTTVNSRDIVHTYVDITPSQESDVGLYVGISVAVLFIIAGIAIYMKKFRGKTPSGTGTGTPTETDSLEDKKNPDLKECEPLSKMSA